MTRRPFLLTPNLLLILCLVLCTILSAENREIFHHYFNQTNDEWQEIYLLGATGGRVDLSSGAMRLTCDAANTAFGMVHTTPLQGNFYVEAEFTQDDAVQLALIADKNGKPDPHNWTSIAITTRDGKVYANHYDRQNGFNDVHDPKPEQKIDPSRYQLLLDGSVFSVPFTGTNKKVRILHEALSNTFRFYFGTRLEKWGFVSDDWMELAPLYSWLPVDQKYYVALICRNEKTESGTAAEFKNVRAVAVSPDDRDDSDTGFHALKRTFNWSGFTGEATVVSFGDDFEFDKNIKFVFWDRANNAPAWRLNNQFLLNFEFFEAGDSEFPGCHEAMSDRQRHGQSVTILEDNAVRKVVHWHGIPLNPNYNHTGEFDGGAQRPFFDEYWTFYPDGTALRHLIDTPKMDIDQRRSWGPEFVEAMPLGGTLVEAGDICDAPAMTVFDMDSSLADFYPPRPRDAFDPAAWDREQIIISLHFKDRPDFYLGYSQSPDYPDTWSGIPYQGLCDWHNTDYAFSHWPVGRELYGTNTTGDHYVSRSYGSYKNEVTHTSLISWGYYERGIDFSDHFQTDPLTGRPFREYVMLLGVTNSADYEIIRDNMQTWLDPGAITMLDNNCVFVRNDRDKRALVFENTHGTRTCRFQLAPSHRTVRNPAFQIQNWSGDENIVVRLNDQEIVHRAALVDESLLVWIKTELTNTTIIEIQQR